MIQPSQLYINQAKLDNILLQIQQKGITSLDPIPIKELNSEMVATDGHTRLIAHYLLSYDEIEIIWEQDELHWELYEICVNWCHDNDIYAIRHLEDRIISSEQYQKLWIERCQNLKTEVAREKKS